MNTYFRCNTGKLRSADISDASLPDTAPRAVSSLLML